jgi:hypothetical protein
VKSSSSIGCPWNLLEYERIKKFSAVYFSLRDVYETISGVNVNIYRRQGEKNK